MKHKEDYKENYEDAFEMRDRKHRSSTLTNDLGWSEQRALLYAAGMDEEDMKKLLVAIIDSFSEMVPGRVHLRELAEYVKQGIIEAGGVPRQLGMIAICDGLCQGHKGMCYPLVNRGLIVDPVEMMAEAHHFGAMVLLPGCDKIIPGTLMAAVRLDIPAVITPDGPMLPGNVGGNPLFCSPELREYSGHTETGTMAVEGMKEAGKTVLSTVGGYARLGTANSMCMLTEVLDMALPGAGTGPAVSNRRRQTVKTPGRCVLKPLRKGIVPKKTLTRKSILNGVAGVMATGSSTNPVPHLMAVAHGAGVELDLEDFDRTSRRVPFACNLQPSRKYPIILLNTSGGISAVLKTIESRVHGDVPAVAGNTLRELLQQVETTPGDVSKSVESPQKPEGDIAVFRRNSVPRGAMVKQPGVKSSMCHFKGKTHVFDPMGEVNETTSSNTIEKETVIVTRYKGSKGGSGMREMPSATALTMGRGMDEGYALITNGRSPGTIHGSCMGHMSPETTSGGPVGLVEDRDVIEIDIIGRGPHLEVSQEELEKRKMAFVPVKRPRKPALTKYAALVSSADTGAVINVVGLRWMQLHCDGNHPGID